MTTRTWQLFVGCYEDDEPDRAEWEFVLYQETFSTYEVARSTLETKLRSWLDDTCPICKHDAEIELGKLAETPQGEPFRCNIEGDDYVLEPAPQRALRLA